MATATVDLSTVDTLIAEAGRQAETDLAALLGGVTAGTDLTMTQILQIQYKMAEMTKSYEASSAIIKSLKDMSEAVVNKL